jgi:hypothetical protein
MYVCMYAMCVYMCVRVDEFGWMCLKLT